MLVTSNDPLAYMRLHHLRRLSSTRSVRDPVDRVTAGGQPAHTISYDLAHFLVGSRGVETQLSIRA